MNIIIIEDASLEILPARFATGREARVVTERFGILPDMQILDKNYHQTVVESLREREKRGRPDVVHFAMLDVTSTPLFADGHVRLLVRTHQGFVIEVKSGTRLPRTLQRYCGVMAKLISGEFKEEDNGLFNVERNKTFASLVSTLKPEKVITFTSRAPSVSLRNAVEEQTSSQKTIAWVVGGFAHGDFKDEVIRLSDKLVSISGRELPAHVVTARLCYALEENLTH